MDRSIWDLISVLRWSAFGRIGLLWLAPYHKETRQSKRDYKIAKAENKETDDYIKAYVRNAEQFAVKDLPF